MDILTPFKTSLGFDIMVPLGGVETDEVDSRTIIFLNFQV
jgi:hypothetical protein